MWDNEKRDRTSVEEVTQDSANKTTVSIGQC